jgi:uncharacterized LabA/DUF88 family protein
MEKIENNFAFIDGQNLNLGIQELGWKLDFSRFRQYLKEKYAIKTVYYFIGYISGNQDLYSQLQKAAYILVFKRTFPDNDRKIKGNVDADLVLQAMIDFSEYDKAVIVSSDGDYYSLVKYLYQKNKLRCVMSPYNKTCSSLHRHPRPYRRGALKIQAPLVLYLPLLAS